VADYGEWKTGRGASGTVTSAVVFALWPALHWAEPLLDGYSLGMDLIGSECAN